MQALLSRDPGGPETLVLTENLPEPQPGPGEAVVAVKACGVNFMDALMIEDLYQHRPARPFAPGAEVAGVVTALGEGVTGLALGDRVLGSMYSGGMASAIAVKAADLVRIPEVMPYEEAAGFIVAYGTAWHALKHRGELKAGQRLLVLGAAGGVGLAAVELGKALGAHVTAGVSSEEKAQLCRDHGADETLVYPRGPFDRDGQKALAGLFRAAAGPGGFDAVLDVVGDAYSEAAVRCLAWGGKLLVVGFTAGEIPRIALNLMLLKSCDIRGVFWGDWTARDPDGHQQAAAEVLELYCQGRIRPLVSAVFPLAEGGAAIAHLAARQALGKVVVTVP